MVGVSVRPAVNVLGKLTASLIHLYINVSEGWHVIVGEICPIFRHRGWWSVELQSSDATNLALVRIDYAFSDTGGASICRVGCQLSRELYLRCPPLLSRETSSQNECCQGTAAVTPRGRRKFSWHLAWRQKLWLKNAESSYLLCSYGGRD